MCKVYNQIGSLTAIKTHLRTHNITEFNSLNDLISFQKNYSNYLKQITSKHIRLIEDEKTMLKSEIYLLEQFIESSKKETTLKLNLEIEKLEKRIENIRLTNLNIFNTFINYLKKISLQRKIKNIKHHFDTIIINSSINSTNTLNTKINRYNFILSHFLDAVHQSELSEIMELERRKNIIEQITPSIFGAIGENKVSKELENLPDDYILINDFNFSFHKAIYNRKENDYIKSIQIDHILISPAGIFLIETKNWSEQSLNNLSLRSPVEQIKRTNFALYRILNNQITTSLDHHHWGERKIPIKSLIVLVNQKPKEEFQYVKILTLKELRNYIEYFSPIFSKSETETIANYLLNFPDISYN